MSKISLIRMDYRQAPALVQFKYNTIFQIYDWMRFVSHTENAEPVVAVAKAGNDLLGRFPGLVMKKYGLRILGSPFPG